MYTGAMTAKPQQVILHPSSNFLFALTIVTTTTTSSTSTSSSSPPQSSTSRGYLAIITLDGTTTQEQGQMLSVQHLQIGIEPGCLAFSPDDDAQWLFILDHAEDLVEEGNVYLYKMDIASGSIEFVTALGLQVDGVESMLILPALQSVDDVIDDEEEKGEEEKASVSGSSSRRKRSSNKAATTQKRKEAMEKSTSSSTRTQHKKKARGDSSKSSSKKVSRSSGSKTASTERRKRESSQGREGSPP